MMSKLLHNKQLRQVVILYISSLLSVLLGVGTSVINTSYLTPETYGDVRYVNNIISFVASLLLLGYFVSGSRLLALSKSPEQSRGTKGAMVVILGITTIVMMASMVMCYFLHRSALNEAVAPLFLCAIPICMAPLLQNYANTVFQGDNSITKLAIGRVLPTALYLLIAWLLFSQVEATSQWVLLLQNGFIVLVFVALIISTRPSFKHLKDSFDLLNNENKSYGFDVYVGSVAGVSMNYLAGITLGIYCENNVAVGLFTLATTLVTPLSMLPTVIGTTYFKRFANQHAMGGKVITTTLFISLASLLLFVLLIPHLVSWLYDKSYAQVASIAQFLAIGTTLHGLGDLFNRFLGSHGLGKQLRNGAFLCGGVMLVGNILLVYWWGINGAIVTRILASAGYCGAMLYYYIKHTH